MVMVQVEHWHRRRGWAPTSDPVPMPSDDVVVWLPPGRVRVRITDGEGKERVTDPANNQRARTVRLSGKDR